MLSEVIPTTFTVLVAGQPVAKNIPSYQLAESVVFNLPEHQRSAAVIVPTTTDGRSILLG